MYNKGKYWHPDCDAAINRQQPPPPQAPVPELDIESLLEPLTKRETRPVQAALPRGPECDGCALPIIDVSSICA